MPIIIPGENIQRAGTLLTLVQDVCLELGLPNPQAVVSSADPQILQILAIARRLGKDLVREFEWQELVTQALITTMPDTWNYPLAGDWNRQIEQTEWMSGNARRVHGPLTSQQWQFYRARNIAGTLVVSFRINGNHIELLELPTPGESLTYEYISENWVVPVSGARQNTFTADDDSYVFAQELMQSGIKLRWLKAKGLAFDDQEYRDTLSLCKAQNKSAPVLSISPRRRFHLLDRCNVPESGYGQ